MKEFETAFEASYAPTEEDFRTAAAKAAGVPLGKIAEVRLLRRSIDARSRKILRRSHLRRPPSHHPRAGQERPRTQIRYSRHLPYRRPQSRLQLLFRRGRSRHILRRQALHPLQQAGRCGGCPQDFHRLWRGPHDKDRCPSPYRQRPSARDNRGHALPYRGVRR